MLRRSTVISYIEKMPENIQIDELIEKFIFIEKLENRILESNNNETIEDENLEKEIDSW